jgi:ATP-binding cassette subfamily A (ABC1) protein 3
MTVEPHIKDNMPSFLTGQMGFYLILPQIILFLRMVQGLLVEKVISNFYRKEGKIKEGMKMMGMSNSSFYLSWIITYEIIYFLVSLMVAGLLKARIFRNSDFLVILVY